MKIRLILIILILQCKYKLSLLEDIMIDPNLAENPQLVKEKMIKQGLSKDEFLVKLFDKNQEEALEVEKEEKENEEKK